MKIALVLVAGLASVASAQSADLFSGTATGVATPGFSAPRLGTIGVDVTCLWDNGPLETSPGHSQLPVGDTILGYGHQTPLSNSVGDDFTVSGGGWNISDISFFAYQTGGSTAASSFTGVTLTIYSGAIGNTSTPVYTTSGLASSTWSGLYRNSDGISTLRPIYENNVATAGLSLADGAYWVAWNTAGSLTSGPWAPPVTPHTAGGANGMQQIGATGVWTPVVNGGHGDDFPFCINGEVVPAPASMALLGLGGLFAGRRRR